MANFNQPLKGLIEPPGLASAPDALRLAFYQEAGKRGVARLRKQLGRAIGADGARMLPRKRPRSDGANGPVMTPHRSDSRTRRLLDARATANGVTLYWHSGHSKTQKLPWSTILSYHAGGLVKGAPVRDVRLAPKEIEGLKAEMSAWWLSQVKPKPKPAPGTYAYQTAAGSKALKTSVEFPAKVVKGPQLVVTGKGKPGKPPAPKPIAPKPKPPRSPVAPPKPVKAAPIVPKPKPVPAAKPAAIPAAPKLTPKVVEWTPRKMGEFRHLTNSKEMEAWGETEFKAWASSLSPSEAAAIRLYASEEYKWMNAYLRGDASKVPEFVSKQGAQGYIDRVAGALARGKTSEPVVAYRGVKDYEHMGLNPKTLKPGAEITVDSFASTTLSEAKARDFAFNESGDRRLVIKINLPAGTRGAYLNAGELSQFDFEREFLMPHGARFRFVKTVGEVTDVWGKTATVIVLEHVP